MLDEFEYYEARRRQNYAKAVFENSQRIDASLTQFRATCFAPKPTNKWYAAQKDRVAAMKRRRDARLEMDRKVTAVVPSFVKSQMVVRNIQ